MFLLHIYNNFTLSDCMNFVDSQEVKRQIAWSSISAQFCVYYVPYCSFKFQFINFDLFFCRENMGLNKKFISHCHVYWAQTAYRTWSNRSWPIRKLFNFRNRPNLCIKFKLASLFKLIHSIAQSHFNYIIYFAWGSLLTSIIANWKWKNPEYPDEKKSWLKIFIH